MLKVALITAGFCLLGVFIFYIILNHIFFGGFVIGSQCGKGFLMCRGILLPGQNCIGETFYIGSVDCF